MDKFVIIIIIITFRLCQPIVLNFDFRHTENHYFNKFSIFSFIAYYQKFYYYSYYLYLNFKGETFIIAFTATSCNSLSWFSLLENFGAKLRDYNCLLFIVKSLVN